jgi:hypothetical protein
MLSYKASGYARAGRPYAINAAHVLCFHASGHCSMSRKRLRGRVVGGMGFRFYYTQAIFAYAGFDGKHGA